jgi:hypothetical protein
MSAPASAYDGDWVINGQFERTTAPSFTPGFNPNDVDTLLVQFDNRRKTFSVRLDFFEAPSTGAFTVNIGRTVGSSCVTSMTVGITHRNLYTTVLRDVDSRVWIPDSVELIHTAVGASPSGVGWRYDGIDASGYRWIRIIPGHYSTVPTPTTDTILDPDRNTRVANLNVDGIDGSLTQSVDVNNSDLSWTFVFSHPYLSNLSADCAAVYIPGRSAPLMVLSSLSPVPTTTTSFAPAVASSTASAKISKVITKPKKKKGKGLVKKHVRKR